MHSGCLTCQIDALSWMQDNKWRLEECKLAKQELEIGVLTLTFSIEHFFFHFLT